MAIRSWAIASSSARSRLRTTSACSRSEPRRSFNAPSLPIAAGYPHEQRDSTARFGQPHNGTVAPAAEIPMFAAVTAAAPRPIPGDRDLAAAGIGLLASETEAAKAAEKMLRKRYNWA